MNARLATDLLVGTQELWLDTVRGNVVDNIPASLRRSAGTRVEACCPNDVEDHRIGLPERFRTIVVELLGAASIGIGLVVLGHAVRTVGWK